MSFNVFVQKYLLKTTSNLKIYQVLCSAVLNNVGNFPRERQFSGVVEIVNIHPSTGTHWLVYIYKKYFDSCGCGPPNKLSRFIRNEMDILCSLNTKYKVWSVKEILFLQPNVFK